MTKELKTGLIVAVIIIGFFWGFNFLKGHDLLGGKAREFKVEYSSRFRDMNARNHISHQRLIEFMESGRVDLFYH